MVPVEVPGFIFCYYFDFDVCAPLFCPDAFPMFFEPEFVWLASPIQPPAFGLE
jgi:hypothetical protein